MLKQYDCVNCTHTKETHLGLPRNKGPCKLPHCRCPKYRIT